LGRRSREEMMRGVEIDWNEIARLQNQQAFAEEERLANEWLERQNNG